jgi:hypothetical protein
MSSPVEEFDVTLAVSPKTNNVSLITKYALGNFAQMDVCGLRNQLRAIRVLRELLEKLRQGVFSGGTPDSSADLEAIETGSVEVGVDRGTAKIRIHISETGLRIALRFVSFGASAQTGLMETAHKELWFAPLFMDAIEFDASRNELSMLMLPDDVSTNVTQAIAIRRRDGRIHDVLSHVMNIVSEHEEI